MTLGLASVVPPAAAAFMPSDPLAPQQWYLAADRAFDSFPPELPALPTVRVAVIDSGLDCAHPEFRGRVVAARSFVGGSACTDQNGHGTFVAGEIAAATDNGVGIAGIAFPARLMIAKIATGDGTISVANEARAIRWAAANGARVINLSLGGLRDPANTALDTFSQQEADAVSFAVAHGAVVVAAVGNGSDAPSEPWPYASYPAALPHVLGVSAYSPGGAVPAFSDRDARYNDIAAPGTQILSTLPAELTAADPSCPDQGYSDCGGPSFRSGAGTSFAAPQVSAAAALLIAARPTLRPDQVTAILERSARDMTPTNGCDQCAVGHDAATGWGRLDIASALDSLAVSTPPADRYEPNDDAGTRAYPLPVGVQRVVATLDYWDDPIDVYRIVLRSGQRLKATLDNAAGVTVAMTLWRPGTLHVTGAATRRMQLRHLVGQRRVDLSYVSAHGGNYYLELNLRSLGSEQYTLHLRRRHALIHATY